MSRPTQAANERPAWEHAARYEALRDDAIERYTPMARHGLVVLLRQGVAAWMDAWSTVPAPPPRSVKDENSRPCPLPDESSAEMVRLLAAMTLGHMKEVHV